MMRWELDDGLEPAEDESDALGYELGKVDGNMCGLELDDANANASTLGCDLGEMEGGVLLLELGEDMDDVLGCKLGDSGWRCDWLRAG